MSIFIKQGHLTIYQLVDIVSQTRKAEFVVLVGEVLIPRFCLINAADDYGILSSFSILLPLFMKLMKMFWVIVLIFFVAL